MGMSLLRDRVCLTPTRAVYLVLAAVVLVLAPVAVRDGLRSWRFRRERDSGRAALARHDFPAAVRHLASALAERPRDPGALLLAAQAARRDGQLDEAQDYLDRHNAAVAEPGADAALQHALVQVQRGRISDYVKPLLDHLEVRHPQSEQICEALAQGSVHVYRLNEAAFWIRQLRERYPANPVGRLLEAQSQETLRHMDGAQELARRLVADYPEFDRGRLCLASLLVQAHQYGQAAEQYRTVLGRRPDDLTCLLGLLRCALGLGQSDEARELAGRLEQVHPDQPDGLLESARFALDEERLADAERLLRRALELAPSDREGHYLLGLCLDRQGRREEARRHAEQFQRIEEDGRQLEAAFKATLQSPGDPRPRLEAARICLRNAQTQEGLRWLYGVLEVDPRNREAHAMLAAHFAARGDRALADYHSSQAR